MAVEIAVALITGGLAFAGVVISNLASGRRTEHQIRVSQAVTEERLSELTREVREIKGFAQRMPVVEERINGLERRVEEIERRALH